MLSYSGLKQNEFVLWKSILRCGPVAQLGARFHGMEEVQGSNPCRSTKSFHLFTASVALASVPITFHFVSVPRDGNDGSASLRLAKGDKR